MKGSRRLGRVGPGGGIYINMIEEFRKTSTGILKGFEKVADAEVVQD